MKRFVIVLFLAIVLLVAGSGLSIQTISADPPNPIVPQSFSYPSDGALDVELVETEVSESQTKKVVTLPNLPVDLSDLPLPSHIEFK